MKSCTIPLVSLGVCLILCCSGCHKEIDGTLLYSINLEEVKEELEATNYDLSGQSGTDLVLARWKEYGSPPIFEYLLQAGVDPSGTDRDGNSLLMYSCDLFVDQYHFQDKYFDLLLEYGANIHYSKNDGTTALDIAAQRGDAEKVQSLIELGAEVTNHTLSAALLGNFISCEEQCGIVQLLYQKLQEENVECTLNDSMKLALDGNSTQLINSLNLENVDEPLLACITAFCFSESLDHIFPKFVNNNLEYDLLNIAAFYDNDDTFRYLLERYSGDKDFILPAILKNALIQRSEKVISILERENISFNNTSNITVEDVFFDLAQTGNIWGSEWMLDHGYVLNDNLAGEILACAIDADQQDFLQFLFNLGIDINYGYPADVTPISYAAECGNLELVQWLVNQGAKVDGLISPLGSAAFANDLEIIQFLYEKCGADINGVTIYSDGSGVTALETAIGYGYFDVIKYLVKHGADTQNTALMGNLYNEDDPWMSALDYASMKESEHIIEYFQTQDRK